jgi:AcrR family transcriptional regulator
MARPREFDEEQALARAMEVFWKQGYHDTSLDDLLEAMGIQRGSFYNTFRSKKETYLRAIDRYADFMANGGPYTHAAQMEPGFAALTTLANDYIESVTSETEPRGCFLAHVAKEHRGNDPTIRQAIIAGIERMRGIVTRSVEAAQRDGDLPSDASPEDLALLFMSVAWGIHVMAEAGLPREHLKKAGGQFFAMSRTPA